MSNCAPAPGDAAQHAPLLVAVTSSDGQWIDLASQPLVDALSPSLDVLYDAPIRFGGDGYICAWERFVRLPDGRVVEFTATSPEHEHFIEGITGDDALRWGRDHRRLEAGFQSPASLLAMSLIWGEDSAETIVVQALGSCALGAEPTGQPAEPPTPSLVVVPEKDAPPSPSAARSAAAEPGALNESKTQTKATAAEPEGQAARVCKTERPGGRPRDRNWRLGKYARDLVDSGLSKADACKKTVAEARVSPDPERDLTPRQVVRRALDAYDKYQRRERQKAERRDADKTD